MSKRDIGLICSMSYYEMKLMTCALSRILLEMKLGELIPKKVLLL